ncbi:hypothetical protein GOB57_24120 [Sinorhizobium meliloti]|nr:hypothetical protein [Sinorhizobium meliloti]
MVAALTEMGVENALTLSVPVGESRTFVIALLEDGVFEIDSPPSVYEYGAWIRLEEEIGRHYPTLGT